MYLQASAGNFTAGDSATKFKFALVAADDAAPPVLMSLSAEQLAPPPAMPLSAEQKAQFMREGVLVLRDVVPALLVGDALRAINAALGAGAKAWTVDEDGKETLSGGLGQSAALRDLLVASPLLSACESLLGPVQQRRPNAQVALRFPMEPTTARSRPAKSDEQWHIDGMNKEARHMSPFQLLVGVALSAQPDDECGNLHVWPREHARTFEAVREMRAERDADPAAAAAASADPWLGHRPALPADGCAQVHLMPGDVVLAHQKTPHRIGLNRSPHIRYQAYYRLSGVGYSPEAPLRSLFGGWSGLEGEPQCEV